MLLDHNYRCIHVFITLMLKLVKVIQLLYIVYVLGSFIVIYSITLQFIC